MRGAGNGAKWKWPKKVLYNWARDVIFGKQREDLQGYNCVNFEAEILSTFREMALKHAFFFRNLGIPKSKIRLAAKQR